MPGRMSKAMSHLSPDFRKSQSKVLPTSVLPKLRQNFAKFWKKKRRMVDARFAIEQRAHSIA
jgi:hypothetical protein